MLVYRGLSPLRFAESKLKMVGASNAQKRVYNRIAGVAQKNENTKQNSSRFGIDHFFHERYFRYVFFHKPFLG